jgi:autotransporter-associated beta strand protein
MILNPMLSERFRGIDRPRRGSCARALGCGAVFWLSTHSAFGEIIYSGVRDIAIPQTFDGVFIRLTDPVGVVPSSTSWHLNPFFGGLGIANSPDFQPLRVGTGNEDFIRALALGTSVGASSTFSESSGGSGAEDESGHLGPGVAQFTADRIGYMGFKLMRNGVANYGWMRLNLTLNDPTGRVLDWAYDSTGNSIITGAVKNLGAQPFIAAGEQTVSASQAGSGILMDPSAKLTFNEGPGGGVFAGTIDGDGEIKISGAGGLRLSGDNTFAGKASVLAGSSLTVTKSGNLGRAQVAIGASASLIFDSLLGNNGPSNSFSNSIIASGALATLNNSGGGKVILDGDISSASSSGGSIAFSGGAFDVQGRITGASALVKDGAGTVTLAGANTYSGPTTVSAGTLVINGVQSGSGDVNIGSTGRLGGSGSVIGGLNVSGVLAPGNSIESFGSGSVSFAAGSTYAYEFQSLGLNGDLTYSAGALNVSAGSILTMTDLGTSTPLAEGSKLTLVSTVGGWNGGLFSYDAGAGLVTLVDDSDILLGSNIWRFNYNDLTAGSNFVGDTSGATHFVTITVVPELDVVVLLGGFGVLMLLRRRR